MGELGTCAALGLVHFGRHDREGVVLDLANAGPDGEQFAIVQVEGARDPLIVPVMKILGIGGVR